MEIRIAITRDDYEAFRRHAERRALVQVERPRFRLLIIAWAILAVFFTWAYTATDWAPRYILSGGFGIALGLILFHWGSKLQQADLSPEEGGYLLGARTIAAIDGGLRVHSETMELTLSHAAIRAVEQTADHIFVYIDKGAAVIVPKRAFASPGELSEFLASLAIVA